MDETVYKIALAGYLHDIGKFAERAYGVSGSCYSFPTRNRLIHIPENGHNTKFLL